MSGETILVADDDRSIRTVLSEALGRMGYDVRAAVKEQVESLGAKFVDTSGGIDAEAKSGYAKELTQEQLAQQRATVKSHVAAADVVITTALVPGRKAPVLVTSDMVAAMKPGSVIVDLAAERGGNCELTRSGETVSAHGVTIIGPVNVPSLVPFHASQMYSSNVTAFFTHLAKGGRLEVDLADEIARETLVARDGQVVHPRVREALGLPPAPPA